MKCSLDTRNFLVLSFPRSLVFPILLLSSISLHWSLKKAFLSLLAILWNSTFSWVEFCLVFPFIPCLLLLFSALCKASSDNHFAFLRGKFLTALTALGVWANFFFFEMVLVTASCTVFWNSVHSSSGILSTRSNPLTIWWCPHVESLGLLEKGDCYNQHALLTELC